MKQYLNKLMTGQSLSFVEMKEASELMLSENISDSEIAAFLIALKAKGESVEEMAGLATTLKNKAHSYQRPSTGITDNCGTGGDGSQSFNISTTAAFVIAGAGEKVAKHGNRSISSKTGSADVLESLGVALDFSTDEVEELLNENGIAFLFAPYVHPKVKRIGKVRKELKLPTIFNLIGPLTNPVPLETQLIGIYRRDLLEKMAQVLKLLGRERAIVINGAGYLDEASLAGENHFVLLDKGNITKHAFHPSDVGLHVYENNEIRGGSASENAEILLQVLQGKEGPHLTTVLLNAGLSLYATGRAGSIEEGIRLARHSITSGAALKKLRFLQTYSNDRKRGMIV
ncbi:anthranilate phosphoribosyltransferase [Lottiidibacillus patelloidae]|uniref:Anthranilate phosphoribosyltransferase n=1 Tax=Lottiidibacillus patelloidae TaxID=2670334 RepID=A0A263BWQ7_9BACI|nr:anthranilate phosphoribosyltransferase [Lottiidibacillus patelloidae]OZM58100.1 anthranilate phosphoribosyltransferase [Lottiidibacillus patelloidae]